MNRFNRIVPEYGEVRAVQTDPPLLYWPDGSLKQLDSRERGLNQSHSWFGHQYFVADCLACQWENAI